MAFFNATTEKGKAKVSAMQDFVDGLEANDIPIPDHVREELDYYNNILVRHVADQYLSDSGEKLKNYDVPDYYAEETQRRKSSTSERARKAKRWQDQTDVNNAFGIIMGERPSPDEDEWLSSSEDYPVNGLDAEATAQRRTKARKRSSKSDAAIIDFDK